MIVIVDVFSHEIDIHFVNFLKNAVSKVGKDSYNSYASNSCDYSLLIHFLLASSECFLEMFHHKDLTRNYLRNLVR